MLTCHVSLHAIANVSLVLRNSGPCIVWAFEFALIPTLMLRLARRCQRTFFQWRNFASEASSDAYDGLLDLPHLVNPLMFCF